MNRDTLLMIAQVVSFTTKNVVYCAYCAASGKSYIGYTTMSLQRRMDTHRHIAFTEQNTRHFYCALRKYGWDAFEWFVLYAGTSRQDIAQKERQFIDTYNTNNRTLGYNIKSGGDTPTMSEESKRKQSLTMKGRYVGEKNPFYDKRHTPEMCARFSKERKGKPSRPGTPHSEETKVILRQRRAEWLVKPENRMKMAMVNQLRTVVSCPDLGLTFNSMKETAHYLGIKAATLRAYFRRHAKDGVVIRDGVRYVLQAAHTIAAERLAAN